MIDINWLAANGTCKKYTAGQKIPVPGGYEMADRVMYILLAGRVDVFRASAAGGTQTAGSLLPGDVFGGREFFTDVDDCVYAAGVDSIVYLITQETFNELSWARPDILFDVFKAAYMPLRKMSASEKTANTKAINDAAASKAADEQAAEDAKAAEEQAAAAQRKRKKRKPRHRKQAKPKKQQRRTSRRRKKLLRRTKLRSKQLMSHPPTMRQKLWLPSQKPKSLCRAEQACTRKGTRAIRASRSWSLQNWCSPRNTTARFAKSNLPIIGYFALSSTSHPQCGMT